MPPQLIGRYEIERELGEGGMAVVYLAHDPNFDRRVVVKVIKSEFSSNPEFRARFSREARVIAKLEHEAIVPVYDFGEHDGQPFIVMRCMTGGTLADRLERGPLALPETANLIARIADALDHAHANGIIHRDLKPGNILFDERGKAYLSDFGIAKSAETATNLTGTAIIGTPAYMSPEQARAAKELDRRSDVYSLGVMVFELLTGQQPFSARDALGLLFAHVNDPIPDIRKVRPDLPRESDGLIKRALAKKPNDRYATTGELAVDLSKIATKPSKGQRPAGSGKTPTPPKPATPAGDLRPTIGPDDNPAPVGQFGELPYSPAPARQFGKFPYIVLSVVIAFCALAALAAGIIAVPGLLATRTSQATDVAVIDVPTSLLPTDDTPTRTLVPPTPTSTPPPTITPTSTRTSLPTITLTPTLGVGSTTVSEKDGMMMVFVPEGDFTMGSNDGDLNEKPVHTVTLDSFWIDKTEVTNAMFLAFLEDMFARSLARRNQTNQSIVTDTNGNQLFYFISHRGSISPVEDERYTDHAVVRVTWYGATAYCQWAGRRLPTEAEWEKAARGDDERIYPWGNEVPDFDLLNFSQSAGFTTEVGKYHQGTSPYGAMDMAGNAWEWVNDWYADDYYGNSPVENPQGPADGTRRVMRGGSWNNKANNVRTSIRASSFPYAGYDINGFRCALSP